jgi:UDP-N-acetylmuramate--alanine ligase
VGTGTSVTGQDRLRPDPEDPLHRVVTRLGIDVQQDGDSLASTPDVVVPASYVPDDHPALLTAHRRGIRVIRRLEMLQRTLAARHAVIAVAGGTGKSTTTALLHQLLRRDRPAGLYVAAACPHLDDLNYEVTSSGLAVVEACEFKREFLALRPAATIVTNLLWGDHADYYASQAAMHEAFASLLARSPLVVVNAGDEDLLCLSRDVAPEQMVSVGETAGDWRVVVRTLGGAGTSLDLIHGATTHRLRSPLVGRHNALNLALAAVACVELGEPGVFEALRADMSLQVPRRRVEPIGVAESGGLVVDDYAHNPVQLSAGIDSVRLRWPERRVVCIFQPSVHSRVRLQLDELCRALAAADAVGVLPIQNGSLDDESDRTQVSSADLISALTDSGSRAIPLEDQAAAVTFGVTACDRGAAVYVAGSRRAAVLARNMAAALGRGTPV